MKMFRKSQAAMEFLMTYGWAILVVLVAIGALAYFGVLNPDQFLPAKCTLPAGIACVDHRATASGVQVVLQNGMGYDLSAVEVSISGCGVAVTSPASTTLNNGDKKTYTAACAITTTKFNEKIGISYTITETGLDHVANGSIVTRVG